MYILGSKSRAIENSTKKKGILTLRTFGAFNNYVDNIRGEGVKKMSVFVHTQGIKSVQAGGGGGHKMAKFCPCSC